MLRVHRRFIVPRYTAGQANSGRREEMLSRVALESANLLKVSLMAAAAMWAIWLLALVETTNTAQAEDRLPENGKISYARSAHTYAVDPDGSNPRLLSHAGGGYKWSPDGTEFIFYPSGSGPAIMSADGSNLR